MSKCNFRPNTLLTKHDLFYRVRLKGASSRYSALLNRIDFIPDVNFFDTMDAGPRSLAKALKDKDTLVCFEAEGNKDMKKFMAAVEIADIIKFSNENVSTVDFVNNHNDKLFIQMMGADRLRFALKGHGWINIPAVPVNDDADWEGCGDTTTAVSLDELSKKGLPKVSELTIDQVRIALERAGLMKSSLMKRPICAWDRDYNTKVLIMSKHSIASFIQEYYPEYYSWHEYPVDQCAVIHKVKDEWGLLCNFGDTPLVVNGVKFANVEQLFQMMKFRDREALLDLYSVSGLTIKMKAKKWENTCRRDDWGKMIVDAIKFCLVQKYEQCPEFRDALEKSRGLFIVEDQSSNNKKSADTWGVKRNGNVFAGPNLLGRLLMELRDTGILDYKLPEDALDFTQCIMQN